MTPSGPWTTTPVMRSPPARWTTSFTARTTTASSAIPSAFWPVPTIPILKGRPHGPHHGSPCPQVPDRFFLRPGPMPLLRPRHAPNRGHPQRMANRSRPPPKPLPQHQKSPFDIDRTAASTIGPRGRVSAFAADAPSIPPLVSAGAPTNQPEQTHEYRPHHHSQDHPGTPHFPPPLEEMRLSIDPRRCHRAHGREPPGAVDVPLFCE